MTALKGMGGHRACLWGVMALWAVSAGAQDVRVQLHDLGQRACHRVWDAGGLGGIPFAAQAVKAGRERGAYCACVGEFFETQTGGPGKEDTEVFMIRLIRNAMTACLEPPEKVRKAEVTDGDLVPERVDYDRSDADMCAMALRDDFPMPGFDSNAVRAQLRRTGQKRDDLCVCAARYFTARGEPLQQALQSANNPVVVYGSTMAGAINACLRVK